MAKKQYGLVIDTTRCMGCHACSVTCKVENNLPKGIIWNRVVTDGGESMNTPKGTWPNISIAYYTLSCQHCSNPACVKVCPVAATWKDDETGIVMQDYDRCIGCRMCMAACPYSGVRSFNWEEPKYSIEYAVGAADAPLHQKHTVEKCTLCAHRIAKGGVPECTTACPNSARHFGDFNDPESEVSKLIATRQWKQLLPSMGTQPNVYFLV